MPDFMLDFHFIKAFMPESIEPLLVFWFCFSRPSSKSAERRNKYCKGKLIFHPSKVSYFALHRMRCQCPASSKRSCFFSPSYIKFTSLGLCITMCNVWIKNEVDFKTDLRKTKLEIEKRINKQLEKSKSCLRITEVVSGVVIKWSIEKIVSTHMIYPTNACWQTLFLSN